MEVAKEMSHPNVLCCLDIILYDSATYIFTEFCDSDLARAIKLNGPLPADRCFDIFCQILKGYAHIRDKGFIHRDLKPANILLRESCAKIADFGFTVRLAAGSIA